MKMTNLATAIKVLIKKIILLFPNGERIVAWIIEKRRKPQPAPVSVAMLKENPPTQPADPKSVFTDYYFNNFWGNKESVSGAAPCWNGIYRRGYCGGIGQAESGAIRGCGHEVHFT